MTDVTSASISPKMYNSWRTYWWRRDAIAEAS